LGVLGVALWAGAKPQMPTIFLSGKGGSPPGQLPDPPTGPSPMDEPRRLIRNAQLAFQDVHDYTCILIKRERLRQQMQPDHLISMRVRSQPFSIYMKWQAPRSLEGQEACYVAGKNNGMMRVHSSGLLSLIGWVPLDPRDPRAMDNTHHAITEAGIGNLIERLAKRWDEEWRINQTQVNVSECEVNHRACTRVELTHPPGGKFTFYRSLVYFDKETRLPLRIENYSWPQPRGPSEGFLEEVYSYVDVRLNVKLPDEAFNY
jgi:hypothetical protein